jgi:NADP-dependent 3-hydroxy acid dehydrogenase YdfG
MKLKKIAEQTIVITGADSGIGLVTSRMAARAGARLVLVARNGGALDELSAEIGRGGGRAVAVVADVGDESGIRRAAEAASELGGFDTWVNNAGVSIFGRIEGRRRVGGDARQGARDVVVVGRPCAFTT